MKIPSTIFSYDFMIREQHLDTFGHVNNAAYLTILEEARWELITQRGYGLKDVKELGLGPVILEVRLTYDRELKNRDQVKITTQCTAYEGKIGRLEQKILNSRGEQCSSAEFVFGLFDTKARKLVLPTEKWLKAIGAID